MINMKLLAPSILSANFANLAQDLRSIEMGGADWVHCDIMDGHFVPNITFGPMLVKAVKGVANLPIDCHLMIEDPDKYIDAFADAGADYITVHQEAVNHLHRTIQKIKSRGVKAGVVLNPATPVSTLEDILEEVDIVLIMSVNPGFGGQKFITRALDKIKKLDSIRKENNYNFIIQIDGGITVDNVKTVSEAGCDCFVAGSSVFGKDNISAAAIELKNKM